MKRLVTFVALLNCLSVTAFASIGRVQTTCVPATSSYRSSFSVPWGQAPMNGDTLILAVQYMSSANNRVQSIAESGCTWTRIPNAGVSHPDGDLSVEVWEAANIQNASPSATVTLSISRLYAGCVGAEYSGLTGAVDQVASNTGVTNPGLSGTTSTTRQSGEAWISFIAAEEGVAKEVWSSPTNGYSLATQTQGADGLSLSDRFTSAVGSAGSGLSWSYASDKYVGIAITLPGVSQPAPVAVTTSHNDNARTGLNPAETTLNPANVNANTFKLLFSCSVDGYVYAQPLYVPNLSLPGKGTHNVVFVETERNSVYAFDADSAQSALWHVNLGPPIDLSKSGSDLGPYVGITSTPVLSLAGTTSNTMYVVARTQEVSGGKTVYVQRLHALDVTTGNEKFGGPVVIQGQVNGTGDGTDGSGHVPFNPQIQNQRAALLYLPSNPQNPRSQIYFGHASLSDQGPYHGWLFAYDANTLQQTAIWNSTPNATTDPSGNPLAAGGIWQSGAGPASDGSGIYIATGNGTFSPTTSAYGDSIVKLGIGSGLTVGDYFTPYNQYTLDVDDSDLGSGGVLVLPDFLGSSQIPHLLVQVGKGGSIYLVNRDNMGKYGASDHIVQELPNAVNEVFGMPAYFNGHIYLGPENSHLVAYAISNAQFTSSTPTMTSSDSYAFPGPTPSISSNGSSNGIVWTIQTDTGSAILHAYDARTLNLLYNSANTGGRDALPAGTKFSVPTVANGKVYVGTKSSLAVFGEF